VYVYVNECLNTCVICVRVGEGGCVCVCVCVCVYTAWRVWCVCSEWCSSIIGLIMTDKGVKRCQRESKLEQDYSWGDELLGR